MRAAGMSDTEIGGRIKKSPERVAAIAEWTRYPRPAAAEMRRRHSLSPVQRRVMAMLAEGQSHAEIGARLRRSERYVRQVEGLAHFRRYREILG